MSTTETIAEVVAVKEKIIRLSTQTEASETGPQDPLTKDAAKAVRAKFLAAAVSLDEAGNELTRMLGAQVNQALKSVASPAECVELVRELKGGEVDAEAPPPDEGEAAGETESDRASFGGSPWRVEE